MFDSTRPGELVETAPPRVTLRNAFAHPFDSAIAAARTWNYYRELSSLLIGDTRNILNDIWHIGPMSHPKRLQKIDRFDEKRAIEIARYVLPLAAFTTMVHTLSGIVLHRLWRMCAASDTPREARAVIGAMVAHVKEIDAQFFDRFGTEPLDELPEWKNAMAQPSAGEPFAREFDAKLAGKTSRLVDYSPNAVRVMAESYRAVAGLTESQCSDLEA